MITAMFILMANDPSSPADQLVRQRDFVVTSRKSSNASVASLEYLGSETEYLDSKDKRHRIKLNSRFSTLDAQSSFDNLLSTSASLLPSLQIGLADKNPSGVLVVLRESSPLARLGVRKAGERVETSLDGLLVSHACVTRFYWMPLVTAGRNPDFGGEKESLSGFKDALLRWRHSEAVLGANFVDNIQRVAGREMVAKVDKDQNVYVDMNELSRHRGWNFSISLEPARADVRIGNDHIKIYPGADRIHINDELVTLPGTVPTQGYGVYLPLRLLQERGYLPSEG